MSSSTIETFPNPRPERDYEIAISCPEFTSLCPKTGLPDSGVITVRYVPGKLCLELKSFKMYTLAYRNLGIFQENVVNCFLRDIVKACRPMSITVTGDFAPRLFASAGSSICSQTATRKPLRMSFSR